VEEVWQRSRDVVVCLVLVALAAATMLGCNQQGIGKDAGVLGARVPVIQLTDAAAGRTRAVEVANLQTRTLMALQASVLDQEQWEQILRITIQPASGTNYPSTPPVIGSYEVDDSVVRFIPMFPFDRGRLYVVTFDASLVLGPEMNEALGQPLVSVIGLPMPEIVPSTIIEQVYPTASVLPENQLKLYVHFSAPMSAVDGLRYISLLDEGGNEVEVVFLPLGTQFWDRTRQRYTVFFDPGRIKQGLVLNEERGRSISEGGTYTLIINESWPDAEGIPLREGFRKQFRVGPPDTEPIDPLRWILQEPQASTREPLVVSFPEPLDHGLLERVLSVTTMAGDRVAGESKSSNGEMRWAFVPSEPWAIGEYSIVVLSILEDLAGNRIGTLFEINALEEMSPRLERDSVVVPFSINVRSSF
jgi:predicted small secreted protein